MQEKEVLILENQEMKEEKTFNGDVSTQAFDSSKQYSDEYYEEYAKNFQQNTKKRLFYRFVKRAFDLFASTLALIILSPLFLIVAIAIKVESKGPVFFKQKRVGRGGKEFNCIKFRSMYTTAPKNCATSLLADPTKHITKVGRIIRKLSIDELPQLFCCFVGTMSVIGYRPLVLTEQNCHKMREELGVYAMRPGISGYSQVHGRDNVYYKNKAIMDAYYVKNASLWMDLKLIFKTVAVVFTREGNDSEKQDKKKKQEKNNQPKEDSKE